jgi:hypothetical protein
MWINIIPFFVQVLVFVIFVRIIVGAVTGHNRRVRVHGGCCQVGSSRAVPVTSPVETTVAAPATVTQVKQDAPVPVASVNEPRFCPSCGAQRTSSARFCTMCGSELA